MLSQLVYVSNRNANCTDKKIEKILEACKRNNPALGITGVLLYSKDKFIQLVEGEARVLTTLYDKIKLDNRHSYCMMVSYAPIKEKSFPSWHMGSKSISNDELKIKTDITSGDRLIFEDILIGKETDGERTLNLLRKFF